MTMMIIVKRKYRDQLKSSFGCNGALLSKALHFRQNSPLCWRIRSYAMNYLNGVLIK